MFRWLETPQDFYVDTRGLRLSAEQAAKMEAPAGAGKRKAPGGGRGGAPAACGRGPSTAVVAFTGHVMSKTSPWANEFLCMYLLMVR